MNASPGVARQKAYFLLSRLPLLEADCRRCHVVSSSHSTSRRPCPLARVGDDRDGRYGGAPQLACARSAAGGGGRSRFLSSRRRLRRTPHPRRRGAVWYSGDVNSYSTLLVWLVLGLTLVGAIGGFIGAIDPCADDGCPPSCGDCVACGQVAQVPMDLPWGPVVPPPSAIEDRELPRPMPPPRSIDHVPLLFT